MTIRLFLFLTTLIFFTSCSVGTSTVPKGHELQKYNSDKIDSIIRAYCTSVYKLNINDSVLNLTLGLTEQQTQHHRRRGFFVDRLIYQMRNYLDSVRTARITITNVNNLLKTVDTYTYDYTKLNAIKQWSKNDPIYLYFMSMATGMDNDKYDELASISYLFSSEFADEKKLNTFDPDFAYYIDKFVSEMYGEPKGFRQRKIMEAFYKISFDPKFKHIKPTDILPFINYADSIYYLKSYPDEIKAILLDRKN